MATIDVLLPVQNGIAYLGASLDSLGSQTFKDWRALVLDHGSTDGSFELAVRYSERDPRFQVVSFPQAAGLTGLLNQGLELADCRYLLRHDADDICYPHRMETTLRAFREMPLCAAIGGQADVIDGQGVSLGSMTLPIAPARVAASSFFRNPVAHPAATFDFAALRQLGIRYGVDFLRVLPEPQRMQVDGLAEDYFLFGQLAQLQRCANVPQSLIQYRWHGGNVGATKYREQMLMSLRISRNLAASFCMREGLPAFDPAPFCNLGDTLFAIDGAQDFGVEFERMSAALRRGFGSNDEVEREIDYRRVVSTRNDVRLMWRYLRFSRRHAADSGERKAIRSWMMRHLSGRDQIRVSHMQVDARETP